MGGRVKRKAALADGEARAAAAAAPAACWLCERPLGVKVEWHHPRPKSRGGRDTVPVHPICHRTIHAEASNAELALLGDDRATLTARPGIARFLAWIADKPADFRAPVRRAQRISGS